MCILIYDIDGTLTYAYGDIQDCTGFDTYAFWPLISRHFSINESALKQSIAEWDVLMKTEIDPTGSSYRMMQETIRTFISIASAQTIRDYAKTITLQFFNRGVLREDAISHLKHNLEIGNTCVFSTGSYQEGAIGFVDGLVEAGLLTLNAAQKIIISGAIVNWGARILVHANVRERKIVGLENTFKASIHELKPRIAAVFADDPLVNDRDILRLAPKDGAYVIPTNKNRHMQISDSYKYLSWEEIIMSCSSGMTP